MLKIIGAKGETKNRMRRILIVCMVALFAFADASFCMALARTAQEQNQNGQVLTAPHGHRRLRHEARRHSHRGIGGAFGEAGRSAGRGGRRFGREMARGRPVRAGGALGRGMGGFGKHSGRGFGRTGRRIGHVTRRAVTP